MLDFLRSFSLGSLLDDDQATELLDVMVKDTILHGRQVKGYYGETYYNKEFGWVQIIANADITEKGKKTAINITDVDVHCSGITRWDMRIVDEIPLKENKLKKRLIVSTPDGRGMAVVDIVNSDVYPSYAFDEIIEQAQIVGYGFDVKYYASAEDFKNSLKEETGLSKFPGEGAIFPLKLISNRDKRTDEIEEVGFTMIRGVVKGFHEGLFKFGEDEYKPQFIDCIIETEFGDLEIVHSLDLVTEDQIANMKAGATVIFYGFLAADVAIKERNNGIVLDYENNLKLLANSFSTGDPERLRCALADKISYYSEDSDKSPETPDELIEYAKYVQENTSGCHAWTATITNYCDDPEVEKPDNLYPIGTRCILLAYGKKFEGYDDIVFMNNNSENKIDEIFITHSSYYGFKSDAFVADNTKQKKQHEKRGKDND